MIALLMALMLGQGAACEENPAMMTAAAERAGVFDIQGAIAQLTNRPVRCADSDVAYWYLRGLVAARDAYLYGGSPESLTPVKAAQAELGARTSETATAEIAIVVLQAASAAAQSERESMALLLDQALWLEQRQRDIGAPGAPVLTAHEVAGDLWLQVHRFEDARRAYERAVQVVGVTRRITLGLARVAVRLDDPTAACAEYARLVAGWPQGASEPTELAEARTFLRRAACQDQPAGSSRR